MGVGKLTFSGHETFQCRNFWLKKGYDFLVNHGSFNAEDAILRLGVGKNMVTAINYWLRAFSVKDEENNLSELAHKLLSDNGWDPYLEDEGTLWLLQYLLVKKELATIFPLVYKDFRKAKVASQFTISQLFKYLVKETTKAGVTVADNSLKNDIKVFLKTYFAENTNGKSMEDDLSSILIDLNLISKIDGAKIEEGELYQINVSERKEIPTPIFLFCILDSFPGEESITFDSIHNQVADAFACNTEGLELHIEKICDEYSFMVYKEDAGRKEVQVKGEVNKWQILEEYYNA